MFQTAKGPLLFSALMICGTAVFLALTPSNQSVSRVFLPSRPAPLQRQVSVSMQSGWDRADIAMKPNSYSVDLYYKEDAAIDDARAERDAKYVVHEVLQELIADGRDPYAESTTIHVSPTLPVTGATGKTMYVLFGEAYYDYGTDSVKYTPCTGSMWSC